MHTNLDTVTLDRWLATPPDEYGFEVDLDRWITHLPDYSDEPDPIFARYVPIPGVGLTATDCPWCGKSAHAKMCAELRAVMA